jgi:large subunit ribosomal protein L7Ae
MSKSYYVKYDTPKELVDATFEALRMAKQTGKVRKGTNETTKAIERGIAKLVIIAEDVEPPEVVAHLPIICKERNTPFVFIPRKSDLGPILAIDVGAASVCILEAGEGQEILDQIITAVSKLN